MACQNNMITKQVIVREGSIQKKSSVLKQWRHRFLVLNPETLCVFKKEGDDKKGRTAKERIFLMDISSIQKTSSKKKKFCMAVIADGRTYVFNCASEIDRELWMRAIKNAQHHDKQLEENDPIRRKSMKLTGGLKRITIERKKGTGLGCTIKSVGGIIFVNRILEHGTVSSSGALRPGDQIVDVNGIELVGRSVAETGEIIRSSPEYVICTVKPVTDFRVVDTHDAKRADYAELDLSALRVRNEESGSSGSLESLSDATNPPCDKPEPSEDTNVVETHQEKPLYEEPKYDIPRRHSVPLHRTTRDRVDPGQGKGQEEDLLYLELEFPDFDRPRLKSDTPTKPSQQHNQKQVAPIAAYAYIELDFNDKSSGQEANAKLPTLLNKESDNLVSGEGV